MSYLVELFKCLSSALQAESVELCPIEIKLPCIPVLCKSFMDPCLAHLAIGSAIVRLVVLSNAEEGRFCMLLEFHV
jgi:hypothetical protein